MIAVAFAEQDFLVKPLCILYDRYGTGEKDEIVRGKK